MQLMKKNLGIVKGVKQSSIYSNKLFKWKSKIIKSNPLLQI